MLGCLCRWVCTATRCNSREHAGTHWNTLQHTATCCNTLQHTATRCNTLPHTATHCTTLRHIAPHCTQLHNTAPHYTTLHHTAPHCTTLNHAEHDALLVQMCTAWAFAITVLCGRMHLDFLTPYFPSTCRTLLSRIGNNSCVG
jgi:hypothetical protein